MSNVTIFYLSLVLAISNSPCPYDVCSDNHILEVATQHWNENIQYQYHYHPLPTRVVYTTRMGDCTDYTNYILEVSKMFELDGVKQVHGYITINNKRVKHDWIMHGSRIYDYAGGTDYQVVGIGVW